MGRSHKIQVLVALTVITSLTVSARADQLAIAFDTDRFWSTASGPGNFGWQFTARSDIQISSLGLYDNAGIFDGGFPGDGFVEPHAIGIWDVAKHSDPLVSALIPAGSEAPLVSGFRYVSTSPVTLSANHEYVISALYRGREIQDRDWVTGIYNNPDFVLTVSPEIDFGGYRSDPSSMFIFPEVYVPTLQFAFGPNFTYNIVPEPSSLALSLLTAIVLCWRKLPT